MLKLMVSLPTQPKEAPVRIGAFISPRFANNNFDFLRLLLSGTVCLVHAYELSGFAQLSVIVSVLSSAVAVKAFFVVSGFLVTMSYERSVSASSYAAKRIRRIYPAYFVTVMVCAIGFVLLSEKSADEYFSAAWFKYVAANLVFLNFLQPTLPGVFDGTRLAAVNGALWTLKIEVMFYFAVPLLVWSFRRFGHLPVMIVVYVLSFVYGLILHGVEAKTGSPIYGELARQLPGQMSYFIAGTGIFYFFPVFERYVRFLIPSAVLVLLANSFYVSPVSFLEPAAIAVLVIFFGMFCFIGNVGKYGDFSYGIYILHFPIVQLLLHLDWFRNSPWNFLAAAVFLSVLGGVLMWHLIERPFLSRSSHYVAATSSA